VVQRPELVKAHDIKEAAPDQEVILTVHELKRLARNAAELMTLSGQLQAAGVQLELLTGPLRGIYAPTAWARCSSPSWPPPPRSSATTSGRSPCSTVASTNRSESGSTSTQCPFHEVPVQLDVSEP
jgi:hypothetical protein